MVGANEVQKDLETGTSWQQATGEAIDGPLKGTRLKLYPVVRTTWAEWRKQHPNTMVLKPLPGYAERMRFGGQGENCDSAESSNIPGNRGGFAAAHWR
jgi:hypothetical protein